MFNRKDNEDVYSEVISDIYHNKIINEKTLIELQAVTMKKKKMILNYNHLF